MSRVMEIKVVVPEEKVGGIIADLEGRFLGLSVGVIKQVPFHKNKPSKKKKRPWTKAQRANFMRTLRKKKKLAKIVNKAEK